jgi:hypothetical protein
MNIDSAGIPDELLRQVEESDAQLVFERDGCPVAVLVSARFMNAFRELAEELENRLDLHAYGQSKREFVESGEEAIPYEEFRPILGHGYAAPSRAQVEALADPAEQSSRSKSK